MSRSPMNMVQDDEFAIQLAKEYATSMISAREEMINDDEAEFASLNNIRQMTVDYATDMLEDFKQTVLEELHTYLANVTINVEVTRQIKLTVIDN